MRYLVDMCVDIRVAEWLRSKGHDAVHLRDEGLQRLPNGEIFIKADREHRAIVTLDLDFSEIAALSHGQKVSVVVFRLRNTRARHVIERLDAILPQVLEAFESPPGYVLEVYGTIGPCRGTASRFRSVA